MATFAAAVVWACRTPTRPRGGWRLGAEAAVVVLGMLLFSERTWKHHCVTLALPFAVLCYVLVLPGADRRWRTALIGTLAVAQALMATTSTSLWPDAWAKLAQVYGAYVAAYVVLTAALIAALRWGPADPGAVAAAPDPLPGLRPAVHGAAA
jgi:hypothetical protein